MADLNPLQQAEEGLRKRIARLPAGTLQQQLGLLVAPPAGCHGMASASRAHLVTSIDLQGAPLSLDMAELLADSLSRATSLRTLGLRGCLAPLAGPMGGSGPLVVSQLCSALGQHPWLTALDLSWNNLTGQGEALDAVAERLVRVTSSLTSLELGFNLLRARGARQLVRAVLTSEARCGCPLAHLGLQRTELGPAGAGCIAKLLAALTFEDLPPPSLPDPAEAALAEARQKRAGGGGGGGGGHVAKPSGKKPPPAGTLSLTSLDLRQNSLVLRKAGLKGATRPETGGMAALAAALACSATLTSLQLGSNALGYLEDSAVRALAAAIARNRTLTALDASDNMLDGGAAALLAGAARGGGALATLDLRKNRLMPKGSRARPLEARPGGDSRNRSSPGGVAHACAGCHAGVRHAEGRAGAAGAEARAAALAGRRLQGRPFQTHRRAGAHLALGTASRPATASVVVVTSSTAQRRQNHGGTQQQQQQQQQQRRVAGADMAMQSSAAAEESVRRPASVGPATSLRSRFEPNSTMHPRRGPSPGSRGTFPRGSGSSSSSSSSAATRRGAGGGSARGLGAHSSMYARPPVATGWGWGSVGGWRWVAEQRSGAAAALTSTRRGVPEATSGELGATAVLVAARRGGAGSVAAHTGAAEGMGEHVWTEHGVSARGGGRATEGIAALLDTVRRPDVPLTTLRLVDVRRRGGSQSAEAKKAAQQQQQQQQQQQHRANDRIFSTSLRDYVEGA